MFEIEGRNSCFLNFLAENVKFFGLKILEFNLLSMSTLELAKKLGCVETIFTESKTSKFKQPFDYLLVLDFEATCWEKTAVDKAPPEIIEFPCVLYDIKRGIILEDFQQYVMPTERPKLTRFCTELTGIQQNQVEQGVPLQTCLFLFRKWLNEITQKYEFQMEKCTLSKKGVFATWSDWDLDLCLKKECKRKNIPREDIFNRWVDIRTLYVEHYGTKPQGLNGALQSLGLKFEGQQHCGLHDARNTAKLAARMVLDGVVLRITKDLSKKK